MGDVPIVLSIDLHVILLVLVGSSLPSCLGKEVGWFQFHSLDYRMWERKSAPWRRDVDGS